MPFYQTRKIFLIFLLKQTLRGTPEPARKLGYWDIFRLFGKELTKWLSLIPKIL